MKTLKKISALLLVFAPIFFIACDSEKDIDLISFTLDKTTVTFTTENETLAVTATPMPKDAAVNFTWTSDKPAVATVNKTGDFTAEIKAIANGEATITAISGSVEKTIKVTVNIGGKPIEEGDGTKEKPYNASQAISFTDATEQVNDAWVGGYIVGGVIDDGGTISNLQNNPEGYIFNNTGIRSTAVFIADSPDETDPTKVLIVKLNDTDDNPATLRSSVNLVDNCGNYKTYIKVQGDIYRYFGVPGIRRIMDFEGGGKGSEGCGGSNEGFDLPEITITDLVAMHKGSDITLDGTKKIVAIVTSDAAGNNTTSKKNVVVTALNNSSGIQIRFTADASFALGDKLEIKLQGSLTKYAEQLQLGLANVNAIKVGTGNITPKTATIAEINANIANYHFCVVTTEGTLSGASTVYGNSSAHTTNTLTDNGQKLDVFVSKYATFATQTMPTSRVSITGIAQPPYSTTEAPSATPQIIIRNLNDVK